MVSARSFSLLGLAFKSPWGRVVVANLVQRAAATLNVRFHVAKVQDFFRFLNASSLQEPGRKSRN